MIYKKIVNRIYNKVWFDVIIGIVIFLKTMLFYTNTIAIVEPLELKTIIGTISFILAIILIINILPRKQKNIGIIIIDFIISILLFGDNIYYTFSNNVLSIAQISNLQYGGEIAKTLPMVIELKQILYFLDIIIIIGLIFSKIVKIQETECNNSKKSYMIKKVTLEILGIIIFILLWITCIEEGKQKSYNKDLQIREATIFGYHVEDIANAFSMKSKTKYKNYESMVQDYNKLKEQYEEKYGKEKYPFMSIVENKNIIILQLESVQDFVINKEINGKEITPNINKFLNENIRFTNMHMQSYSTTADSEHSTITSIYPMENGMSFSKYYTNAYDDIFKIFNNNGYHTSYMHGNYPYFWNRGNVYGNLQLNQRVLKEQFSNLSENINGDLSDELLYKQAVQKMKDYQTPFLSYIVSASSHTPFSLDGLQDRNKVSIDVGKYKGTYFGNYLEAMNYADYAFGIFIQELKDANIYDETAILLFGDHNGLNMYNDEMVEFLKNINTDINDIELKLNYTRVVCGLKVPGIGGLKIEKPVNKLDIKPTLTYIAGIEDGFSLGTNMFKSKEYVCLNNERIITNNYYYDEKWYDIKSGNELNIDELEDNIKNTLQQYYNNMKDELDISYSVSVNNLLK